MAAFTNSLPIVTTGLVLYLDARNPMSYPKIGNTWNDLSRNNYSGSLVNGPTFSNIDGGSLVFNGTNSYIDGRVISSGSYINGYTINSLYRLTATKSFATIFSLGSGINLGYGGAGTRIQYYIVTSAGTYSGDLLSQTNGVGPINYVTATWDGQPVNGTLKYYINGDLLTNVTVQGTITDTTSKYGIGIRSPLLDIPFVGNIYNVSLYNRPLSQDEVSQNYKAQKSRLGT